MNRAASLARLAPVLLLAIVATTGCSDDDAAPSNRANLRSVGVEEFHELVTTDDEIELIDVRTPAEFAEGHLAGAVNVDFQSPDFGERIAELDPRARYAVYCRSGNRSGQAMAKMGDAGFDDVTNMDGGTNEWTAAGFPLE